MYVVYFDEVKHDPPQQDSYWVGGVAVEIDAMLDIERKVASIAKAAFGSDDPVPDTELHAKHIFHGKRNCKGKKIEERLEILSQLCAVTIEADAAGVLGRIYARIIPENMIYSSDNPAEVAFMYFIEQVDRFLDSRSATGVVIGDYDKTTSSKYIIDLAFFKQNTTRYARGRNIERIVDCVHYAQSHHSRMVQLADHFIWSTQLSWAPDNGKYNRKKYQEILNECKFMHCSWSRHWPTQPYWYR